MPSVLHEKQIRIALRWLKAQGFSVVASNIRAAQSREIIDAIGFRDSCSIVIESKISRSDFMSDRKKPERHEGAIALGTYRFYICPPNLIKAEEVLPLGWGLLYAEGSRIIQEFKPKGNLWPCAGYDSSIGDEWIPYQHLVNPKAERSILFSICRRLIKNEPIIK